MRINVKHGKGVLYITARTIFMILMCFAPFLTTSALAAQPSAPSPTVRMGHIAVGISDIGKAINWYKTVFGMKLIGGPFSVDTSSSPLAEVARALFGKDMKTMKFAQMAGDSFEMELFEFQFPGPDKRVARSLGFLHLGVVASDIDAVAALITANGGEIIVRSPASAKTKVIFCRDPDGNVLEVSASPWQARDEKLSQ